MIKRGNKQGSHVAVVISFVIFVTFMVFLYSMARSSVNPEEKENSLVESLKAKLINEASAELITITVNFSRNSGINCIELNGLSSKFGITPRIIVKNQNQTTTDAALNGDDLRINRITREDKFFKVYNSPEFSATSTSSWNCEEFNEFTHYTVGLVKTEEYVFEEKILDLINNYNNYENMKEYLKIPEGSEFGLGFIYENGTSTNVEIKDVTADIYVKEEPVQYVSRQGDISTGFLRVMVW